MKKIFLPFIVFSVVSCNNDNDPETTLTGKWKMYKAEVYKSSTKQTETHIPAGCDLEDTHEFRSTNMTTVNYGMKENVCVPLETITRNYTYDNVTKQFWYEGEETFPYQISKLTQTDMIIEDHMDDSDKDGELDVIKRYFRRIN